MDKKNKIINFIKDNNLKDNVCVLKFKKSISLFETR